MSEGRKDDGGKARMDLLPVGPLQSTARVFTFGADKYADRNWEKGIMFGRVYAAALRHLLAWWDGDADDEESGESHLGHALCCVMMLSQFDAHRNRYEEFDNRPDSGSLFVDQRRDASLEVPYSAVDATDLIFDT